MDLDGAVCIVTGGGRGIGAALARALAGAGARGVLVTDLDDESAEATAAALPDGVGASLAVDVALGDDHHRSVALAVERFGRLDLYVSNAGIGTGEGIEALDERWQRTWEVNVMAHVHAARAALPAMLDAGRGWFLNVASAAGLLVNLGDAPYTATKHAAVGFAEWLSVTYGDRGIGVSCLCPMGVDTDLLREAADTGLSGTVVRASGEVLPPDVVAGFVVDGLRQGRFLLLPHPEVARYEQHRAGDRERWLAGMRQLQARVGGAT